MDALLTEIGGSARILLSPAGIVTAVVGGAALMSGAVGRAVLYVEDKLGGTRSGT